jgi:hypothetical protein
MSTSGARGHCGGVAYTMRSVCGERLFWAGFMQGYEQGKRLSVENLVNDDVTDLDQAGTLAPRLCS